MRPLTFAFCGTLGVCFPEARPPAEQPAPTDPPRPTDQTDPTDPPDPTDPSPPCHPSDQAQAVARSDPSPRPAF